MEYLSRVSERPGNLLRRGIIFGVSVELTEQEVAAEIQAETLRRLARWKGGRDQVKTVTMIVGFKEEIPEYVYIGCLRGRLN